MLSKIILEGFLLLKNEAVRGQIFVFPASRPEAYKNYLKTIAKPVPLSLLYEELPRDIVDQMRKKTDDEIFAWGATRKGRNPKIWSQMRAGDYVLTYRKGVFICLSRVLYTTHNERLAMKLWGVGKNPDNRGLTWEYVYFLEKIQDGLSIPSEYVFRGHDGPLRGEKEKKLRKLIKDVLKEVDPDYDKTDEELEEEIQRLIDAGKFRVEDAWGRRKVRKAQNIWRKMVLENFNYECAICGINIPELLDAAHIRSWAEDVDNRMNPLNGIALCALHHRAYDQKIIQIKNDGTIICNFNLLRNLNTTAEQLIARYHGERINPPRSGRLLGINLQ